MAVPSAYMQTNKRVADIFEAMRKAGVPPRFTNEFLKQLGFTSSADRSIISVLKALRFLDDSGVPTERYVQFRGDQKEAARVLANAIRDAYSDVFTINEKAQTLNRSELVGAFQRASGKGEAVAEKMTDTFIALCKLADFSGPSVEEPSETHEEKADDEEHVEATPGNSRITFRHDIHVHLPVSTDVSVYNAIFRSIREQLGE